MADAPGGSGASPESGCSSSDSSEIAKKIRKQYQSERDKTRVSLFEHFERWRKLREEIKLKSDKELAGMLLDSYFENFMRDSVEKREVCTQTEPHSSRFTEGFDVSESGPPTPSHLQIGLSPIKPFTSSTPNTVTQPCPTKRRRLTMSQSSSPLNRSTTQASHSFLEETDTGSEGSDSEYEEDLPWVPYDDSQEEDGLEERMAMEDEVFDTTLSGSDESQDVYETSDPKEMEFKFVSPHEAIHMDKCIIFCNVIMSLLYAVYGLVCKRGACGRELIYTETFCGTCLVVSWQCSAGHFGGRWASQPKCEGVRAGNLLLASSICLSGNSFTKIGFLFQSMKMAYFSKSLFNQYQHLYIAPAVNNYWENMKTSLWKERAGQDVILSCDARNDSPGHCAQYCTYNIADMEKKIVLNMSIVDVREVEGRKSTNMERIGFERCLDGILKSNMKVTEVVTDAHSEISALMKNAIKYKEIIHQYDVWHGAKNVTKKVIAAAQEKGNDDLALWTGAIRNHFWYSARNCGGDVEDLKHIWIGMLHHIVDEHVWVLAEGRPGGKCGHEPLTGEERDKPWLKKNSQAHSALRKIVLDKRRLNTFRYYTHFRHTGFLESFHNHILMYCPKRHSYSMIGYRMRNHLAAIDFNNHIEREVDKKADGSIKYRKLYSKRTKQWRPVLKPKEYAYIPDLLQKIFEKRHSTPGPVDQKLGLSDDDPRKISPTIASTPSPTIEELLEKHQSRF